MLWCVLPLSGSIQSRIYTISLDDICKGIDFLKLGIPTKPSAPSGAEIVTLVNPLASALSQEEAVGREQAILSSLSYSSRPVRHETIPAAQAKTFEWVFESLVAEWLKSGDGAFWITEKAGSGKSTLMKFIADHPETVHLAAEFASPKRAFIAAHYFWGPGTPMQRSIQGLLQSLLYDIFRQYPSAIRKACPERWKADLKESKKSAWMLTELKYALSRIGEQTAWPVCFFIFIDGLDEFSGDYFELCDTIKGFIGKQNIKACVSSRPINVFEDYFGGTASKALAVHEETAEDTRIFAEACLASHPRWHEWSADAG